MVRSAMGARCPRRRVLTVTGNQTQSPYSLLQKLSFKKMGERVLGVQFGFQSIISAFQTDGQKNYTLNRHKSQVQRDINNTD